MKYAVISSGNKQYKVAEGDVIIVDRLAAQAKEAYAFEQVLLFVDGDTRKLGMPTLSEVKVTGKILEDVRGPKIRVAKFKAKARYRRVTGFRAAQTRVQIEKIEAKSSSAKASEDKASKKSAE